MFAKGRNCEQYKDENENEDDDENEYEYEYEDKYENDSATAESRASSTESWIPYHFRFFARVDTKKQTVRSTDGLHFSFIQQSGVIPPLRVRADPHYRRYNHRSP